VVNEEISYSFYMFQPSHVQFYVLYSCFEDYLLVIIYSSGHTNHTTQCKFIRYVADSIIAAAFPVVVFLL
jgi:hypothetical protein